MTTGQRYVVYECDVCDRQIELTLDARRPDPIRCNITQKCRGKLSRIGERSARKFLFTPIVSGLEDYIQRGKLSSSSAPLKIKNPIAISSARGAGIIAMAVVRKTGPNYTVDDINGLQSVTEVVLADVPEQTTVRAFLYEISPSLLTTTRYFYSTGPTSIIAGSDDSSDSKILRFTSENQIAVFVNGIQLSSDQFNRNINDQITFTPLLTELNNDIDIFVYKDLSSDQPIDYIPLEFKSLNPNLPDDLQLRSLCSWGDQGSVIIDGVERYILYCTDLTGLDQEKTYGIAYLETTTTSAEVMRINSDSAHILLAKEPFAYIDKEFYAYLKASSLVIDQEILSYNTSKSSGQLFLTVNDSAITQIYTPIKLGIRIEELTDQIPVSSDSSILEGAENLRPRYIIGPV